MVRIECKPFRLGCPDFADIFVWGQATEGLEAAAEVVGVDEVAEMGSQLGMAVVMVAFDRCLFDSPVHPLDLAVGPWMLHLGQTMLDAVFVADPIEDVMEGVFVACLIGELDAVIGQHRMDRIGDGRDQVAQELGSDHLACFPMQFDKGELAGSVDCHEQTQLAFGGLNLGDVDVEVADRVGFELSLRFLVAGHLRQPADPVALQAAVQRRPRQVRDRGPARRRGNRPAAVAYAAGRRR